KGHIEGNTVVNAGCGPSGGSGVMVSFGSTPVVKNNTIKDCHSFGICIADEAAGVIERNNITATRSHGIGIFRRANPVVRGNIVRDNAGVGIFISQAGGGTVSDNRLALNRGSHTTQVIVEPGCSATVRENITG
ncbi:right handed beta helix region-domain-containing protein, partial [Baffinella frigidus]